MATHNHHVETPTAATPQNAVLSRRPRWFRIRLRTLLLALTAAAVWLGVETNRARNQRQAVAIVQRLEGHIYYDYQWDMHTDFQGIPTRRVGAAPPGPAWLRELVGEDLLVRVTGVSVPTAGDNLKFLKLLPKLHLLSVEKSTVTDDGLDAIENQTSLRYLWLEDTGISDAGLAHLRRMKSLQRLYLYNTNVTEAGVAALKRDLPDTRIHYHLRRMPKEK
jgi:hypothetical protein